MIISFFILVFLECTKYTIQQDWLLGMAYLFSVHKNYIEEIHNVLMELPQTMLYIQTSVYYYCLELYKSTYKDYYFTDLYSFNPLSLILKTMNTAHKCKKFDIYKPFEYWQTCLFKSCGINKTEFLELHHDIKTENDDKIEDHKKLDEFNIVQTQSSSVSTGKSKGEEVSTENSRRNEKDKIKMSSSESNDKNDIEWTDNWGNFSDEDIIENVGNKKDILNKELCIENNTSLIKDIGECITEKDRFEAFEKIFNKIRNVDHFYEAKKLLLQWPQFEDSQYTKVNKHPILKMMKLVNAFIMEKDKNKHSKQSFEEYKELIEGLSSKNVNFLLKYNLLDYNQFIKYNSLFFFYLY